MTGQGSPVGPLLVSLGVLLVVAGLIAWAGGFSWLGRLPGDLRFEGERSRVYVPITSMIVVSLALSLLATLIRRLL